MFISPCSFLCLLFLAFVIIVVVLAFVRPFICFHVLSLGLVSVCLVTYLCIIYRLESVVASILKTHVKELMLVNLIPLQ
jgi:hypothetical protein